MPLGQKAALRVDGFLRKDQGYIDSIGNNPILSILTGEEIGRTRIKKDINTRKTYGGRASLLFQATEDLSVDLPASPKISIPAEAALSKSIRSP